MSQIKGRMIGADEIKGSDIRLDNDQNLRARNAANSADVDVLKVNASDKILFASLPQAAGSASAANDLVNKGYADSVYIPLSQKGSANGVATLDGGGKIPSSQLTIEAMEYKGGHNVATNSPVLADGTGSTGDVYVVTTGGTRNYGSGNITLVAGDWLIYSGTIWEKVSNSSAVPSVNGFTGAVVLTTTDIAEGTNLYYTAARFNTAFSGKSTSDLAEGTNLYFTDERAQDAVGASLTDSASIDFTYNDGANTITAVSIANVAGAINIASGLQVRADTVTVKINGSNNLQGLIPEHESLTLGAPDITNQYKDLANKAHAKSVLIYVDGVPQRQGIDYLVDNSGSVSRIKWDATSVPSSDLKTGGAAALVATDVIHIMYSYL